LSVNFISVYKGARNFLSLAAFYGLKPMPASNKNNLIPCLSVFLLLGDAANGNRV
jgi:hypothetical protein